MSVTNFSTKNLQNKSNHDKDKHQFGITKYYGASTEMKTTKNGSIVKMPKISQSSKNCVNFKLPTSAISPAILNRYKIVVLGNGGVGKSALTIQFVQRLFVADYDPTIEDSYSKQLIVDDQVCKLEVLDTAGQEEFDVQREKYIKTADGFLLTFSVVDVTSFEQLNKFYGQITKVKDRDDYPLMVLANKADLQQERKVSRVEGENFAHKIGAPYAEVSAKYRLNVDQVFYELIRLIRNFKRKECPPMDMIITKKHETKHGQRCIVL